MDDLKSQIEAFLTEYYILDSFTADNTNWVEFISLLLSILVDQPIVRPCVDITEFYFLPAAYRCVNAWVKFKSNIGSYAYYDFGNAY
jgi:hypothetical protein